jgi:RNA polymerase sigma-70 factor (ECF subfamily)
MTAHPPDDESRFAAWLTEHGAIPRKLSRAYTFESADADELHQEMLVQLWRSLPRFRGQSQASTWIYRVCLNTALAGRRERRRREARIAPAVQPPADAPSPEASPADAHERGDRLAALMDAVRALPPAERSLVVLALDGLGHREIGEITGLTENHVGVALLRARRKLAAA